METSPLFWDVLTSRQSIRRFKPDPVPHELIERILQTGALAPNAGNRQSWRFLVLNKPEDILILADALNTNYRRDLLEAGRDSAEVDAKIKDRKSRICGGRTIIVLFVDVDEIDSYSGGDPANPAFLMAVQSAALAGGQMLLAAHALGLGGLWMGGPIYAQHILQECFDLPDSWLAQGMLLFGYPDDDSQKKTRRPLEEIVRFIER